MKTGYEVTIRGFIAVDPDNPDSVIEASEAAKTLNPDSAISAVRTNEAIGGAFAQLTNIEVKTKFVNRRSEPDIARAS